MNVFIKTQSMKNKRERDIILSYQKMPHWNDMSELYPDLAFFLIMFASTTRSQHGDGVWMIQIENIISHGLKGIKKRNVTFLLFSFLPVDVLLVTFFFKLVWREADDKSPTYEFQDSSSFCGYPVGYCR